MQQNKSKFEINIDDYIVKSKHSQDFNVDGYIVLHKKTKKNYLALVYKILSSGEPITANNNKQLCDEVEATMYFQHPTFVKYVGFSPNNFEHMPGVTTIQDAAPITSELFRSIIIGKPLKDFTNTSMQIILVGIARSMMLIQKTDFLYILLSPDNIYLYDNYQPLLCPTYCSSKLKKELQKQFIPIYASPEVLDDVENFNDKSDVFSFGILMYQLLTGTRPYAELSSNAFKLLSSVKNGYRPKFMVPIKESFKKLIEQCWSADPNDRPSFETIFNLLAYSEEYYLDNIDLDEYEDYVESIQKDIYFPTCGACNTRIKCTETVFYSGYPFHLDCVKCITCNKKLKPNQEISDFICITNGVFLCKQHYNDYKETKKLPSSAMAKIKEKNLGNAVDAIFNTKFFNDFDVLNQKVKDVFITSDMIDNSYQKDKPYEHFMPIVTFHFSNSRNLINFNDLSKLFKKDMFIMSIDDGSTILKAAFTGSKDDIKKYVTTIKKEFSLEKWKPIIGKLIEEPKIEFPDESKINEIYQSALVNEFQGSEKLNSAQINELKKEVYNNILKERNNRNWKSILSVQDMVGPFEIQINEDIRNNPFEMKIIGQTILVSDYFKQFSSTKNSMKKLSIKIKERILYHGSRMDNHSKIVKSHFLMPGQDKVKQIDKGYYGKGIYATDNIFYASMYGNGFSILKYNEKAPVICCIAIYNESNINEIHDKSYYGKIISQKITNSYGIHHALVGNSTKYWPISPSDKNKNFLVAEEFVFPLKYQIMPLCSIVVMRADHLIIWKDENINNNENKKYFDEISSTLKVNVYIKKTVNDAINLIKLKKFNKIKLITNGGENLTGKKLIEEARKIIKSNFVCLVFSKSTDHLKWINKMENVLFTNSPEMFKKFTSLQLCKQDVLDYIKMLEFKHRNKFNINEDELLKFAEIKELS